MTIVSDQNSSSLFQPQNSSNANSFGYDLQDEKKRIALGTEELKKEILEEWNRKYVNAEIFPPAVAAMHPETVDFLLSFNLVFVYDNIARQAGLDAKGRNELPHIVWEIAGTKNWNSLDQLLNSKITAPIDAQKIASKLLQENIIEKIKPLSEKPVVRKAPAEKAQRKEDLLPLFEAMSRYPNLGEQGITNNPLKLKSISSSVRPSIKNWITDFRENMGPGKHSAIDRANYLFHSDNGKKITPVERQKLSLVLKSLQEKTPLKIDTEKQAIVFDNEQLSASSRQLPENDNQLSYARQQPVISNSRPSTNFNANVVSRKEEVRIDNEKNQRDVFQKYVPAKIQQQSQPNFSPNFTKNRQAEERPKTTDKLQDSNYFRNIEKHSDIGSKNYFNSFSSNKEKEISNQKPDLVSGSISFSSAQKLPVEKKDALGSEEKQVVSKKETSVEPIPPKKPQQKFQWQLRPTFYNRNVQKNDNLGNVVNLKD